MYTGTELKVQDGDGYIPNFLHSEITASKRQKTDLRALTATLLQQRSS